MDARNLDRHVVTRRSLLGFGIGTAALGLGAAAFTGPSRAPGTSHAARTTVPVDDRGYHAGPVSVATVHTRTVPTTSAPTNPQRHPTQDRPAWARPWRAPIYSIDDFLRRSPHTHFPHRAIMLTIDDGPSPEWTPKYLRLLAKHDVPATFCMIGAQVHANRHLVKAVAHDGHHIANHTWTHDEALPTRSERRIRREITDTTDAIVRASGFVPRQFRAPGGNWGSRVFEEVSRAGMMPLGWDIDPRDWALPGTRAIISAMLAAGRHDIILCHDGGGDRSETYAALKTVIPRLKRDGFAFVTLPAPHRI